MHIYKNNYYYYDICEHIKIMDPEGKISSCPRLRWGHWKSEPASNFNQLVYENWNPDTLTFTLVLS